MPGMAFATLTKGPVGFAVPLMTALLYLLATRQWLVFWQRGAPIAGTLLFLILAGPWYVAMLVIHGDAYSSQAKVHTVGRFLAPMEGHGEDGGSIFPSYSWAFILGVRCYLLHSTEPMQPGENHPACCTCGMARLKRKNRRDPVMNWNGLQACG